MNKQKKEELQICDTCGKKAMEKKRKKWECPICGIKRKKINKKD